MRWIQFADGSRYTFAVDIQKFAELNGYKVPCEPDGTRHPGTDCNQKMRSIFKDAGMRRTFSVSEQSVVNVSCQDSVSNGCFLDWLIESNIVSAYYLGRGAIQLYAPEAVNALLSVMLGTHVEYTSDDNDKQWYCNIPVTKRSHNLEKKKYKPKASLFNK